MSTVPATLCLFARAPNLGRVKTRLATSLGEPAALAAHIRLVEHSLNQLNATNTLCPNDFNVQLWLADEPVTSKARQHVEAWVAHTGQALQQQQGSDLGERMAEALACCVGNGGAAVLIGSDCPTVDSHYVTQALAALASGTDLVLGPAEDGGYGLIAVSQNHPELFQGIAWGTDQVLRQTLAKAEQHALSVRLLDPLWDVDFLADWDRFCEVYGAA